MSDSFVTPWTVAFQASLSMGFSRQEHWSGLPCSLPGDLPNPDIQAEFPALVDSSSPLAQSTLNICWNDLIPRISQRNCHHDYFTPVYKAIWWDLHKATSGSRTQLSGRWGWVPGPGSLAGPLTCSVSMQKAHCLQAAKLIFKERTEQLSHSDTSSCSAIPPSWELASEDDSSVGEGENSSQEGADNLC